MEFKWNCQNFGLIYRKAYFDYNRFQETTVFIEIKKKCGRRLGIKGLPGSAFASTVKIVFFSDQLVFFARSLPFSRLLHQLFNLFMSVPALLFALVFLGETSLTVNYKGTHTIHGPPSCHEILEGKHEAFRKKGSEWEQEKTGIISGVQIEDTAEAGANTCSTLFGSFLCRHYTTTISEKLPNFRTFANDGEFFFLFLKLDMVLEN